MTAKLAIDGGEPVRTTPLQAGFHGSAEIGQQEMDAVLDVLRSKRLFRFLATEEEPSKVAQLEDWYRARLDRRYALAVNGGTSALITALYGIEAGPGDEVIIPAYTYVATAAAVIAAGAVPVIAEIDASLNMDPEDLSSKVSEYTKAILPVHMRGVPARMDEIMAFAEAHDLIVVEDVAQSNGGSYKGRPLGTMGKVGCFSFQQYKIITSGEGGLVATDDRRVYDLARMQHDCAARFWEGSQADECYDFVISGENYRLSELSAALVLAQRNRLDEILGQTRQVKRHIVEGLRDVDGIDLQDVPDEEGDCGITLAFFAPTGELAELMAAAINAENISCGTTFDKSIPDRHVYSYWPFMMSGLAEERRAPWHHPLYRGSVKGYAPDQCPQSLDYLGRAIMVFIDQSFTLREADLIVEAIRKVAQVLL